MYNYTLVIFMKALQFTIPVCPGKSVIVQEDIAPNFYPYLHRHKEAQLIWVVRGSGTLIVENSIHLFQPDDIFYLAPNQSHVFKDTEYGDEEDNIHSISVFFDPVGQLAPLFDLPELGQMKRFLREFSGGFKLDNSHFESVSERILKLRSAESYDQLLSFLYLIRILSENNSGHTPLSTVRNKIIEEGEGLRMSMIYNYIMQHFNRDLSLDDVAGVAHLTPQAFCRYFKKHSGITFVSFLNSIRVHEVCKELTRGDYESIASVAYNCGFNSIPNFNRVFKHVTGTTPKTYLTRLYSNLPEQKS